MKSLELALVLGAFASGTLPACHASTPVTSAPATRSSVARDQIRRTLIDKRPATNLPGWETRLYLIEYGPAAVAPLHVHPAVGIGYVLEGTFESAFGTDPPTQVRAGQSFVDPAGVPHRLFRNASEQSALRFVIAYTIREGEEIFYPGGSLPVARTAEGPVGRLARGP